MIRPVSNVLILQRQSAGTVIVWTQQDPTPVNVTPDSFWYSISTSIINITIKHWDDLERQIRHHYDHCPCQEGGECVDSDECSENPCGLFGECINRCHHYHQSSHHRCLRHHFCRYHGSDQVSTGVSSLLSISILNLVIISLAVTNQLMTIYYNSAWVTSSCVTDTDTYSYTYYHY